MSTSLNKLVSFYSVLSAINPPRSRVLPTLVDCHACRGRLSLLIQPDPVLGGEWGWCRRCNTAGDMIELAGAVWKLDVAATFAKMRQLGITTATPTVAEIAEYTDKHTARRRAVTKFYADCRQIFSDSASSDLRELQRHFGYDRTGSRELNSRLPIGAATIEQVGGLGLAGISALKGGKRGVVLVVPFYDLPGRICGLLCVPKTDDAADPIFFNTLTENGREGGIGMLPTALTRAFDEAVVAVTDPRLAITLQLRQAKELGRPLPLILTRTGPRFATERAWENLPMADVVFWAPPDTFAAIKQARPFDAKVAARDITPNEQEHNMRRFSPSAWLQEARKAAEPWHVVLRQHLRTVSPAELEALLLSMEFTNHDLRRFVNGCDMTLRSRLLDHMASDTPKVVQYGSDEICEKDGRWWADGELISDAVVRFDTVVVNSKGESHYRGRLLFREHIVQFTEKTAILENGLLSWAARYLRDTAKIGVMQSHPRWDKKACGVALAFQEPAMTSAVEHVGWNTENNRYVFPHFSIAREGQVDDNGAFLPGMKDMPGAGLKRPEPLHTGELDSLSARNDETRTLWAIIAAITANITAPRFATQKRGIIFPSDTAKRIGCDVSRSLGCLETPWRPISIPVLLKKYQGGHGWPLLIRTIERGMQSKRYDEWICAPFMGDSIIVLPLVTAWAAGMRRDWVVIDAPRTMGDNVAGPLAGQVMVNYLQDTMTRPFLTKHSDHVLATLRDMTEWFERIGGNPRVVGEAEQFIGAASTHSPARFFIRIVAKLYNERKVLFARSTDQFHDDAAIIYDPDANTLWIEQQTFANVVHKCTRMSVDVTTVTASLKEAGGLIEEREDSNRMGWLLRYEWWQNHLKEMRLCQTKI